jgi:hypothetical protein
MKMRVIRACLNLSIVGFFITAGCASVTPPMAVTSNPTGAPFEERPALSPEQEALIVRRTQREQELLSSQLNAESAAEIALLHNPLIERALETLGMSGFDRLQLLHTLNPNFNRGRPPSTMETRIERSISVNAMTWVIIPALDPTGTLEERSGRVRAADEIVALLFLAKRAWINAVATRQAVHYHEDVVTALEAGREIMESMRQVGNSTELELLRAQTLYADSVINLTTLKITAAVERERLIQVLGLWGDDADSVKLPDRLPDLPRTVIGPEGLEARAVSQRFDVHAGRLEGLSGEAGVNARADVRTSWLAYRGAYDLAKYAIDEIVPLANRRSDEQLKLYNGMLVGVFDLVTDATERINAVNSTLDSEKTFWLAEVELQRAMAGVGVSAVSIQQGLQNGFRPGATYHVH